MAKKPRKRPYWYFQWIDECPVCGSSDKGRERRYTPKPNDPDQRFAFRVRHDDLIAQVSGHDGRADNVAAAVAACVANLGMARAVSGYASGARCPWTAGARDQVSVGV